VKSPGNEKGKQKKEKGLRARGGKIRNGDRKEEVREAGWKKWKVIQCKLLIEMTAK